MSLLIRFASRLLTLLLASGLVVGAGNNAASALQATEEVIVVLPESMTSARAARDIDVDITHRYTHVFNGFAARVTPRERQELEQIPGVIVSPNREYRASDQVSAEKKHDKKKQGKKDKKGNKGKHKKKKKRKKNDDQPSSSPVPVSPAPETPPAPAPLPPPPPFDPTTVPPVIPTGVLRIAANQNPIADIQGNGGAIDVDVAVLDTGISPHPDLNVAGGVDCIGGGTGDGNGHGTHVAGTIGALDNGFGVVGVAPGARLHPVRVLNDQGAGSSITVICGLEWVLANAGSIDVVNMSLGGDAGFPQQTTCLNDAEHMAVCNVVNAGIPVIVAAGNDTMDAATQTPANFDEVITVSALSDFNGQPGGGAAATGRSDIDDSFANYSNFGSEVDITAPGTCILSTVPGGYDTFSGTSMATPHVSGAAALYVAFDQAATPDEIRDYLLGNGSVPQLSLQGLVVDDDPDAIPERVLYIPATP
jgi:subtilisin